MDLASDDMRIQLAEIETRLADQQAQNAQMLEALDNTLRLLAQQNSPTAATPAPLPVASATKTKNDLKPS